jgi:hypothetical protein
MKSSKLQNPNHLNISGSILTPRTVSRIFNFLLCGFFLFGSSVLFAQTPGSSHGCNSNTPPEAMDDINNTYMDQSVNGNVLTNDTDKDGDDLTVTTTPVSAPTHGMVSLNADGTYTYLPNAGFTGIDRFEYRVCDLGHGSSSECDNATVEIVVSSIAYPNPPIANCDFYKTLRNVNLTGNVALNDFDPDEGTLTVNTAPVTGPSYGSLVLNPDGTFLYNPSYYFKGKDSFTYEICDDGSPILCTTAEAVILVYSNNDYAYNDPPVAGDDAAMTRQDHAVNGDVLTNDYDLDGDNLILQTLPILDPSFGTVSINNNGTFVYTPATGYSGPDRFVYEVCDDGSPQYCRRATVYITVFPEELFPVEFVEITVQMTGNDAQLNWATATEINSDFFAIERSVDGVYFQEAGQVVAAGNATSTRTYEYTDVNVSDLGASVIFYRLRQVDIDGAFTYSDVVELIPGGENGISMKAYPNPATDVLNVSLTLAQNDGAMDLRMVDQAGRTLMHQSLSASQGFQSHTLNVSTLASGIYYLHATSENHTSTQKVVVK